MTRETITVYFLDGGMMEDPSQGGWRWRWKAANGKVVAAATQGYRDRCDAIRNLEKISGGTLDLTYRTRSFRMGGEYAQGQLRQQHVDTFVQVIP